MLTVDRRFGTVHTVAGPTPLARHSLAIEEATPLDTTPSTREIGDGVYAYVQPDGGWWVNNTGFIVGRSAVVSVDSCGTERRTRDYLASIAARTDVAVKTIVNTHHHGDHTYGNHLFTDATVVGHAGLRENLLRWDRPPPATFWGDFDWGHIEITPPTVTFTDQLQLHVDDVTCEVRHVGGPAHTTSDSVVWIPEQRILFSGDLVFNGVTPLFLQGSLRGLRMAVELMRSLDPDTIVPGHGPVCGPSALDQMTDYIDFVQDVAARGMAADLPPLEAALETDLGPFADLLDRERIVGNLHRAYAELGGAEPGVRLDSEQAMRDMVTYNGGRPLGCLA